MKLANFKNEKRPFSTDFTITDPANNFRHALEMKLNAMGRAFEFWKSYAPIVEGKKKQDALHIDFTGKTREDVDFLEIALKSLAMEFRFAFGFVNLGTHETFENQMGISRKGVLYISEIR